MDTLTVKLAYVALVLVMCFAVWFSGYRKNKKLEEQLYDTHIELAIFINNYITDMIYVLKHTSTLDDKAILAWAVNAYKREGYSIQETSIPMLIDDAEHAMMFVTKKE